MSKLLKLREWLSLEEAAQQLTGVLNTTVLVKDIYRFALDGHLRLSINFVNQAYVKKGEVVGEEGVLFYDFDKAEQSGCGFLYRYHKAAYPTGFVKDFGRIAATHPRPARTMKSIDIGDGRFINLEANVQTVDGIWDLMMVGSERLIVEQYFQELTGGVDITLKYINGAFVEREDVVCQLQAHFDDNPRAVGSLAQQKALEKEIANNDYSSEEVDEIWKEWDENRKKFFTTSNRLGFYNDNSLPEDSVLVVKVSAITEFLTSFGEGTEKPVGTRERNNLLTLIAVLLKPHDGFDREDRETVGRLKQRVELFGSSLSDGTIRKFLKQLPDAVESKSK